MILKKQIVSTCELCGEEDLIDVYTKLCNKCFNNKEDVFDMEDEEDDWQ